MKIKINRLDDAYHMEAVNEDGALIHIDASKVLGGQGKGFRPMQLLLAGIGTCGGIDIISILSKQRQKLEDIQMVVEAEREEGKAPSLFKYIHIQFRLFGNLDTEKVKKAIDLSMDKYCSVANILEKTANISYSFKINP